MTMEETRAACEGCRKCPLYATRTNLVFGRGNESADLMFIGEAPGENEDLSGLPFVGRAGKLLDKYLEAIGIAEDEYYIANILKCRPPHNRDPLPEEREACKDFLRAQVAAVRPKIIVCLGRIAAAELIKPDFKITAEHGKFFKKGAVVMTAIYHPAALLRDPSKKEATYEDMRRIKAFLDSEAKG